MDVAAGFLLAFVLFGANFIELFVVPTVRLEAADVVEAPLVVEACCQRLDAQVKGNNAILAYGVVLPFFPALAGLALLVCFALLRSVVDTRAVVVATCIPGYRYLVKVRRRVFGEMGYNVGIAFGSPIAAASCRKRDGLPLHFQVHGRITQRKKLVPRLDAGEPWFLLPFNEALKERLHGFVQAEVHLR